MKKDREIGKIVLVNTYSALVELNLDSKSYVKSSYTGIYPIGVLNSYVIIPIGADRIVAMVTKVQMREESQTEFTSQKMLVLPTANRTMWVSMVGTISQKENEKEFNFGISRYPELDNPVWLVTEEELDYIFEEKVTDKDKERRLISIGTSPIFSNYEVNIDMDKFFGKHAAILGNTGSGKSCTVKAIIEAVLKKQNNNGMPNASFIIFDTNNEYESAFSETNEHENTIGLHDRLVIRNNTDEPDGFFIPHWLMNGRDFEALFTPAQQTQSPVLANAISRARGAEVSLFQSFLFFQIVRRAINRIRESMPQAKGPVPDDIRNQALSFDADDINKQIEIIQSAWPDFDPQRYISKFRKIHLEIIPKPDKTWKQITPVEDTQLTAVLNELELVLNEDERNFTENLDEKGIISIDTPNPFSFQEFRNRHIEDEIQANEQHDSKVRGNIGSLLLRIDRMYRDPRYKFLFNSDPFANSLASFLRYVFGEDPSKNYREGEPPWSKYYDNQKWERVKRHKIIIIDFSNIASDVLENMTALIGRLILEFMQRIKPRGSYPTVLVLEEAHNYIPSGVNLSERQQRAREVFERIAKEGRKYGLSLVVASQRPSELSRTVLAQCNSFIVHRIQNPDDKEYFKSVMPSVTRDLLDQLPSLAQLVLGDCITVPAQVRIHDVDPKPDSHDPEFCRIWSDSERTPPDFEKICENWGKGN